MAPFPPLDLAGHRHVAIFCIWHHRHVAPFCASSVGSPPRGYFLCIGSGRWITAMWLLSVHRIWPLDHHHVALLYASDWPLDSRHVARFYPSDLSVRFLPCGFFLTIRSGPDLRLEGDHVSITEWLAWHTVRRKWYGCAPSISTWHRSDGYSGAEYMVFVARIERFNSSQVARIQTVFSLCAKSVLCRQ
jgi:hypothetical protein